MKRGSQDVAGIAKLRSNGLSNDNARRVKTYAQQTAYRGLSISDSLRLGNEEAALIEDFADFMASEEELDLGLMPAPDPIFKERLRRRLWRTHVVANLRGTDETH